MGARRRALPRARRALPLRQRAAARRLQGRGAPPCARADGRRRRDHRHHRLRLCRRPGLALRPRPGLRRPEGRLVQPPQDHRAASAPAAPRHQRRVCRCLRSRHGPAQRGQRHHRPRHHVPDPTRCVDEAGGWSSDTICEGTDLGLTILEQGWVAHYTNRRYGRGLRPTPSRPSRSSATAGRPAASRSFASIGVHSCRARACLRPTRSANSHSAGSTGSAPRASAYWWRSSLRWVPVVAFAGIAVPDKVLTLPIMATFAISVIHFIALYRRRVRSRSAKRPAP